MYVCTYNIRIPLSMYVVLNKGIPIIRSANISAIIDNNFTIELDVCSLVMYPSPCGLLMMSLYCAYAVM